MVEDCTSLQEMYVKSRGDNLAKVRKFVADIAKDCGFDVHVIYDIKVAVGEAVANAMEHGSPRGEANRVKIACRCDADTLKITITDEGVFKRVFPGPAETFNYRGHGILLMLAMMDKVTIDESVDGTTVSLTKKFRPDSAKAKKTA